MTLFSDGIASRLLAVNLIYTLEKEGILSPSLTNKVFETSLDQANSFLARLDQPDDSTANLDAEDLEAGLERAAIEQAIDMLQENYRQIKEKR